MITELIKNKWYSFTPYTDKTKVWYLKFDEIKNGYIQSSIYIDCSKRKCGSGMFGGIENIIRYEFKPLTDFSLIKSLVPEEKFDEVNNNYELY